MEASLDTAIVPGSDSENMVFDQVDQVIEQALLRGPDIAMQWGYQLRQGGQTRALAIAHLLYELEAHWESFPTDDTFEDAVFKGMGLSKQTTLKYVRVWKRIFASDKVLDGTKTLLLGKPIDSLLAVSAAAADGQIDEDQWDEIVSAPDTATVKGIVRSIRGRQTSSTTALTYMLDRDGALKYKRGNGHYKQIGVIPPTEDEDASDAIDSLMRRAGVVVR
jgi:hypothetical protein